MIFLIVIGGVIAVALGLAAVYDHRVRRRGERAWVPGGEPGQALYDVERRNITGSSEDG